MGLEEFRGQFVVAETPLAPVPGSRLVRAGNFHLVVANDVPTLEVFDAGGLLVGTLLGHPVDLLAGRVARDRLDLDVKLRDDVDGFVEHQLLARFAGSFLLVLHAAGAERVYLDAGGTMSAVYDPEARKLASSTPLLLTPEEYRRRFDAELHAFLKIDRDGWFPAGLTAHDGIRRLVCNHYLDGRTWRERRHWPRAQLPVAADPEATSRAAAAATRRAIGALKASGPLAFALTGGNESRLMLAACRDIAAELDFVTIANPTQVLDRALAAELAARFGLHHRFLPSVMATREQREAYVLRAGHTIGDVRTLGFPSVAPLAGAYFVNGSGGGVGRGFFWRRGDKANDRIDAQGLATRLGMPVHEKVVEAVGRWLEGTPGFDLFLTLDLAFLELRMAPWAFANAYGNPEVHHIHPLISRPVFEAMVTLPHDWRREGRMTGSIVRQCWPELLSVRINRYGDYRDTLRLIARLASNPSHIARKFRRKFA